MTADKILKKHEDANEYHLHEVDRKWVMEAMEEYAWQAWNAARDWDNRNKSFEDWKEAQK